MIYDIYIYILYYYSTIYIYKFFNLCKFQRLCVKNIFYDMKNVFEFLNLFPVQLARRTRQRKKASQERCGTCVVTYDGRWPVCHRQKVLRATRHL